jgi:hypothetical protein
MQEALLQYIWKQSLFVNKDYIADTGETIKIMNPGSLNTDGGPDFTNAKVLIDNTLWAGNVEIHIKSSDWERHGHHKDGAYKSVILHIALSTDSPCLNTEGRRIPTICIDYDTAIELKYKELLQNEKNIACSSSLPKISRPLVSFWLSALAVERLYEKTAYIKDLLRTTNHNWEEAYYIHLSRSFGSKINSMPFELLAKSIPLKILAKHTGNLLQLEALLFGQAGFLDGEATDEYYSKLQSEYKFLKSKYQLNSIDVHLWKFLRLRPSNFPTIRLAEFCMLIHKSKSLLSKTLECEKIEDIEELYTSNTSDYWKNHYVFGKVSKTKNKSLGISSIYGFIINTVIPFMFVYGEYKNNENLKERSLRFLEQLPPEKNNITGEWSGLGIKPEHAAESQALLQLTNQYCKFKKCLDCQIGNLILSKNNHEREQS